MCAPTMRCIPCAPDSSRNSAPPSVAIANVTRDDALDSCISAFDASDDGEHVEAFWSFLVDSTHPTS